MHKNSSSNNNKLPHGTYTRQKVSTPLLNPMQQVLKFSSMYQNKFFLYDMHTHAKVGSVDSFDSIQDALKFAFDDLKNGNPARCYEIFKGPQSQENSVWWGDSWAIGAFARKNSWDLNDQTTLHNFHDFRLNSGQ
ncbi:MAG: hypothetical protein A3F13_08080 [Gammaproteobacteria bacterium RIFCSPHIGHO2_12_FULL_40_19]|nr:MAG: hypothetical protein A3F13_08080 [Gammaproteobacteria bacterium RIFCSPHIGHO2_12_FULL_40_19]